ncbi:uncharacterized protein BDW43DRAFT_301624 [Aspergillus alliaceus]|uniref:uncharacterized protein n=1 Tax=Petromyces alliaceus TaxID=209559 RepID=UPI0012A76A9A|nr:uncharacterized protein BDW43DRAFT_301624 [Aspergillus alliaceus]KAB8231699.1 hypothetical protein BDW43DRAFT_301624 [Aspergillus alliaceus]
MLKYLLFGAFSTVLAASALDQHAAHIASLNVLSGHMSAGNGTAAPCVSKELRLALSDPPYSNYFYSDCHVAAQVVVTTPLPDSNLSVIGPRLIVAWPGGNSGICAYFAPQSGINGTLAIELVNSTIGQPLAPVYSPAPPNSTSGTPQVGVTGVLRFNSSAELTVPILGSIRTIRDFVEGPSLLYPEIQDSIRFSELPTGGVTLQRLWLDNVTTVHLVFSPLNNDANAKVTLNDKNIEFTAGDYIFSASYNYPQLTQLAPAEVLKNDSSALISPQADQVTALSFLSYSDKLLAGAWRFLTYFGRDSMISALLLEPILSTGEGSAMEAVIGSVLERVSRTDGSVCHEENIGDYATWTNMKNNVSSSSMICDYHMVDTDYFLPILMQKYFIENPVGQGRYQAFSNTTAGIFNTANQNLTWGELALTNAERVMRLAAPFAKDQKQENLIHLHEGQVVGQWRDSAYGIGGGRIPFDINTALVPAALRSIAALARGGLLPRKHWAKLADTYAQTWEDQTLKFFEVTIPRVEATQRVRSYAKVSGFTGPNQTDTIDSDIQYYALALNGSNNLSKVEVMHTDDCFRHFLLNTTEQTQLTAFVNQTANNIRRTFPAGLMTDVGLLVANPAYGPDPVYARNFTAGAYHGTVVWSWQLAMMAKGLEHQLGRCVSNGSSGSALSPDFCRDAVVYNNVREAYRIFWDVLEENSSLLSMEVWSWIFKNDRFQATPLGTLPPPPGVSGGTASPLESNIRQLWSLTFLAVTRNKTL